MLRMSFKELSDELFYFLIFHAIKAPFLWKKSDAITNVVLWHIAERPSFQAWTGFSAFSLHVITKKSRWHLLFSASFTLL
jgi:hypothetical protein